MAQKLHNVQLPVKPKIAQCAIVRTKALNHNENMRLRHIRKSRGLTLDDLADMLGVDKSTVHRAENMDKTAKLATYIAAANALKVNLADLFVQDRNDADQALLAIWRRLSPADQERALAMLELVESHSPKAFPKTS